MAATHEDRNAQLSPGVAIKAPCKAASVGALTLSGEQTVDGVALITGDRVLVKNQASSIDNGIYGVSTGTWDREPDFDGNRDVVTGTFVFITSGATNAGAFYECTTAGAVVFGTSSITFAVGALGPIALPLNLSNTTFTQLGTGAIARTGLEDMRELVSVTHFMSAAQKADALAFGFTLDMTAAFQLAHDSLGTNGGEIDIPIGGYLFNQTTQAAQFTINKSNVTLRGRGWGSQLRKTNTGVVTGNQAIVMVRPLTGDISNIVLRDFRITGPTTNNGTAITGDSRVIGIALHDGASAHVISDVLHEGILIEGMETAGFVLNATSATNNCRRIRYANCWARNCRQDGFNDFAADANEDVTIENSSATDCDGYGMEMSSAKGLQIVGNTIRRCGQAGIGIEYGATQSTLNHVVIVGNKISDITTANYTTSPGISLGQAQNPINTLIEANTIARCGGNGILISGSPDKIDIIGNTIKDIGGGGAAGAIATAGAITNAFICDNTIRNSAGGYTMSFGIALSGAGSATNFVANNEISTGYTVAAVTAASPTRLILAAKRITVAYSAAMTLDTSSGNEFDITATNNTAFSVVTSNDTGDGQLMLLMIRNTSGGALGALTLGGVFKSANTTQPANGFSRARMFRNNGTNWVQVAADVDVPN